MESYAKSNWNLAFPHAGFKRISTIRASWGLMGTHGAARKVLKRVALDAEIHFALENSAEVMHVF